MYVIGGACVEGKEGFLFLSDEHEAVVIIGFIVGGEFDVGDDGVVVLILGGGRCTLSSLVLNQSLALPYLTGMVNEYNNKMIVILCVAAFES